MDEISGGKITGIKQIVKLKKFLQRWQNNTLTPSPRGTVSPKSYDASAGISPEISLRLRNANV